MNDKLTVADEAWIATAMNGSPVRRRCARPDPVLALRGLGRKLWADEEADAYVSRLREGWSPEPHSARGVTTAAG